MPRTHIHLTNDLYKKYQPRIYHYIHQQVHSGAEDLTATVFARALQAQHNGHGAHSNLNAWLYQVARSVINDHLRRKQKEPVFEPLSSILNVSGPHNVEREVLFSIEAQHLTAHLPDYQQDLLACMIDGYSTDQMAQHYDINPATLRQRILRLRRRMKERWQP